MTRMVADLPQLSVTTGATVDSRRVVAVDGRLSDVSTDVSM